MTKTLESEEKNHIEDSVTLFLVVSTVFHSCTENAQVYQQFLIVATSSDTLILFYTLVAYSRRLFT